MSTHVSLGHVFAHCVFLVYGYYWAASITERSEANDRRDFPMCNIIIYMGWSVPTPKNIRRARSCTCSIGSKSQAWKIWRCSRLLHRHISTPYIHHTAFVWIDHWDCLTIYLNSISHLSAFLLQIYMTPDLPPFTPPLLTQLTRLLQLETEPTCRLRVCHAQESSQHHTPIRLCAHTHTFVFHLIFTTQ